MLSSVLIVPLTNYQGMKSVIANIMSEKIDLLAIDDDRFCHKLVAKTLADGFNVHSAFDGSEGITLAQEILPKIILLDVEMPGINGFEVCDQLKQIESTKDIPVVFLTGNGSCREMMQGYEMGGADYLVKPFKRDFLIAKLNVLSQYSESNLQLKQQVNDASKTAYTAMSGSSELGLAMRFVENSYRVKTCDELAKHLLEMFDQLNLNCVIYMSDYNSQYWYAKQKAISPLEKDIVNLLRGQGRLRHFGCRTQINYANLSVLAKDMPIEDMDRYGRMKDLLPTICSAANAKIDSINDEVVFQRQNDEISSAFKNIEKTLLSLSELVKSNQSEGQVIIKNMFEDMSLNIPKMGLEEDQEEYFLDTVAGTIDRAFGLTNASSDIEKAFNFVLKRISNLSELRDKLSEKHAGKDEALLVVKDDGKSEEDFQSIELF